MAMLDNPAANINNNFDGVLDADSCSFDTFSNEDSSDMETFSEVEITADQSDEEFTETNGVYGQGCAYYCGNETTTTSLMTTTIKIDDESLAQEMNRNNNIIDNNITYGSERARGRGRRDFTEEEFSFNVSKQDKKKPNFPGDALLQGLDLSSSLSVSQVVEHIVESEEECDCDCMADAAACHMHHFQQDQQAQDSF